MLYKSYHSWKKRQGNLERSVRMKWDEFKHMQNHHWVEETEWKTRRSETTTREMILRCSPTTSQVRDRYPLKSGIYSYQGVETSAKQGRWEIHVKIKHSGISPIVKIPSLLISEAICLQFLFYSVILRHCECKQMVFVFVQVMRLSRTSCLKWDVLNFVQFLPFRLTFLEMRRFIPWRLIIQTKITGNYSSEQGMWVNDVWVIKMFSRLLKQGWR